VIQINPTFIVHRSALLTIKRLTHSWKMKRPSSIALIATSLSLDNNDTDIDPFPSKRRRVTIDSKWILRELPEMPYLYLKEKTATVVLNDSPQQIANRIVECARSMNCFGEYNSAKVSILLLCN
jgi:hypothetical protein